MALKDQPYLPLYVDDFLSDEKLSLCNAESTGVYIRIMCLMHKSDNYGSVLLKQKFKQSVKQTENFASIFAKQMPYSFDVIVAALDELIDEGVLHIDGDELYQKRMKKDGKLSEIRAIAGEKGGKATQIKKIESDNFASDFALAKIEANAVIGNVNVIGNETISNEDIDKGVKGEKKKKTSPPDDLFETFWQAYPRHTAKDKAQTSWKKVNPSLLPQILKAIAEQKQSSQWQRDGGQYIPHAATWLNQKRWEDELQGQQADEDDSPYSQYPTL